MNYPLDNLQDFYLFVKKELKRHLFQIFLGNLFSILSFSTGFMLNKSNEQ